MMIEKILFFYENHPVVENNLSKIVINDDNAYMYSYMLIFYDSS